MGSEERDGSLRFLELADIHQDFGKRPRILGIVSEKEILPVNALQCDGFVQPPMAAASVPRIRQTASCLHELDDLRPGSFETLAESDWPYAQNCRRLVPVHFQNLTQNVRKAVRTVQAQKHPQRASHPDLLEQNGIIRMDGTV